MEYLKKTHAHIEEENKALQRKRHIRYMYVRIQLVFRSFKGLQRLEKCLHIGVW